jgi:hypothetical protein
LDRRARRGGLTKGRHCLAERFGLGLGQKKNVNNVPLPKQKEEEKGRRHFLFRVNVGAKLCFRGKGAHPCGFSGGVSSAVVVDDVSDQLEVLPEASNQLSHLALHRGVP